MPPLPRIDPEAAGFYPGRLHRVEELVVEGCEDGLYLGAGYLVLRGGAVTLEGAVGLAQDDPECAVDPETVFDLASLTKPVATATSILMLAERGEFHLDEEARRFLPDDAAQPLEGITLRHLLTHTSGLPAWRQYHSQELDRKAILRRVRTTPRERPIGARYVYSDLGYILLGEVVGRVSGQPLDRFAAARIFQPLGMAETTFCPPAAWQARTAATRCADRQRVLVGEVHDGNCASMGGVAGHAGLFGTARDVARFAAMLLAGGELEGARLLSPLAVRRMATRQDPEGVAGGASFGFFTRPNPMLPAGDLLPEDAFGHTGFTGTSLVLSPCLRLAVLLLTNRVYQERDAADFLRFRRRFHNVVAASVRRQAA